MVNQIILDGCSPVPVASYLKALGVLRLLSLRTNSVTGQAADENVRGWWEGIRFHLRTSLSQKDILEFFLHKYSPSPIIAPWNGGGGFYNEKDGIKNLESVEVHSRFKAYKDSINIARDILRELDLREKPGKEDKIRLVEKLRGRLPMSALPWLDASLVLSGETLKFPPILGTGGNDGNLEFSENLMRCLFSEKSKVGLFQASSGAPRTYNALLLKNSLFNSPALHLVKAKVGQFSPGEAGGPNAGTGFEGESAINSWDYVFMLEGAATFASIASRRHQSNVQKGASFPFTVDVSSAGWGGIECIDEVEARAEFWAPLWSRPARFTEIKALFGEGRAVTQGQTARDGLDFARAISTLGISRGFSEFQRYGYFKRAGKNHYAVALGRRCAKPSWSASLVSEMDRNGWLSKVRKFARESTQAKSIRHSAKNLEEAIFELLVPDPSHSEVSRVMIAIGQLGLRLSTAKGKSLPNPPPLLSSQWAHKADDGSPEFRIAAALAGLGIRPRDTNVGAGNQKCIPKTWECAPPMAAHLTRLTNPQGSGAEFETETFFRGQYLQKSRRWAECDHSPTAVWKHGGLVSNMIAVLERRLIEVPIRGLSDKPFSSACLAQLDDVAAFLGDEFNDEHCNKLLSGLVWVQPSKLPPRDSQLRVPLAYAALKPIFTTNQMLIRLEVIPPEASLPVPTGLVAQLRVGGHSLDGRVTNRAVLTAFERARSSGMPSSFDPIQSGAGRQAHTYGRFGVGVRPDRLAASLLIPIFDRGMKSLLRQAYPEAIDKTL